MSDNRQRTSSSAMDKEMSDMDNMADTFASDIMGQAAMNVSELMQSFSRWHSVERAMSESKSETSAEQKVQQHLEKFFTMRRVFAEHCGDSPEDEEAINATAACAKDEDVTSLQSTESANKARKPFAQRFFKRMRLAWKSRFGKKHSEKDKKGSEEKEEEGKIEKEMGDSPSPASTSLATTTTTTTTRSEESVEAAFSASSPTAEITETAKMLVAQVIDEAIRTLQSESAGKAKQPFAKRFFQRIKSVWKKEKISVEKEEDIKEKEVGASPSPASTSLVTTTTTTTTTTTRSEENVETAPSASSSFTTPTSHVGPNVNKTNKPAKKEFFIRLKTAWKKSFCKKGEEEEEEGEEEKEEQKEEQKGEEKTEEEGEQKVEKEDDEDVQQVEEVRIPETGSRSRVTTRSQASDEVKNISPVSRSHEDEAATSADSNLTCSPVKVEAEQDDKVFTEHLGVRSVEAKDDPITEIRFQPGPSEEDGRIVCCQERHESAADQASVPNLSTMTTIIRRFFQRLTDEQWREVSEGIYNCGVKDKLIDLCVDVLKFIADSVIKIVLESIGRLSTTSRISILRYPISSEHLIKIFNCDVQRSVEISFSQAVCDTIGADIPVSISPEFTEAIATEALVVVSPVLSTAIQASVDEGSSRAIAPASSQVSKDRAAKKTLTGAISTMKSILTGRGNAVKRRIMTQKASETNNDKETPSRAGNTWKTEPVWMCFNARQRRRVNPVPLQGLYGSSSSQQSKQESRSPAATSSTKEDPPLNKASTDEVCNIFSKTEKKKNEEKTEKTERPLCIGLLCCCSFEE
ncbi:platelet binding protein GspB-like [Trachinotus anak]|uniref:platelet binding protein GspB-like n=1 Tax=Trachinotus anak TaxID=443729 RepID=UPI0039F1F0CD